MPEEKLQFRISSALKNLIGKELITNEYVAVFELVKNSFDAYAKKVDIIFENIYDENIEKRKIIIKDNGKGMNYDDLVNKWLFVAYSAKIDGTEDLNEKDKTDYRDKTKTSRVFAGAKGVGRFSCDRLGRQLNLITRKDENNPKIEKVTVKWEDFEKDPKEDFINIDVTHETLTDNPYTNLNHGTVLEIIEPRDDWNREKLLALKHSLERLINPNQENDTRNFNIEIIAKEELISDRDIENGREKVNGLIKNFLLETLDLKTTRILSEIINDGEILKTKLIDRGKLIYEIKETNPYKPFLRSNIAIHLFHLNRSAKYSFTKMMGIEPVKYGSVFLYKNGFRIYPFGEVTSDVLGIDRRKQQGFARFFGTRDLLGRIEINDHENTDNLKETTSRDGGLIKNINYEKLVEFFFEKALKRLEKYVVELIKWGEPIADFGNKEIKPSDITKEILLLISNLAKDEGVIDLTYDSQNLARVLNDRSDENLPRSLKSFEILAEKTNNPELQKKARKLLNQFKEHNQTLKETQIELDKETQEKKEKEEELKQRKSQIKFFQSLITRDYDQAINFLHAVGVLAHSIDNNLENFTRKVKNQKSVSSEELFPFIQKLNFTLEKILSYTGFATKANYRIEGQYIEVDLIEFVIQYVADLEDTLLDRGIKLHVINKTNKAFVKKFQPINFKIIFDNLFSNARKVKPKNIYLLFEKDDDNLIIKFKDDGHGLSHEIKNSQDIFEMGYTTTNGSGLGLYNVKTILKEENGTIKYNPQSYNGFELIIRINK